MVANWSRNLMATLFLIFCMDFHNAINVTLPRWNQTLSSRTRQDCVVVPNSTSINPRFGARSRARWVHTALPESEAPANGYYVFIKFELLPYGDQTGQNKKCGGRHENVTERFSHGKAYGVWDRPLDAMQSCFYKNYSFNDTGCTFDQLAGALWEQRYKQTLLANGVAVITLNSAGGWESSKVAWAKGSDKAFLTEFFLRLRQGAFGPLNPNGVFLQGWSAGAHMVSWMIEQYATSAPVLAGVKLMGGIFFSGGSHRCYDGGPRGNPTIAPISDCATCNASRACFSQPLGRGEGCSSSILRNGGRPCCDMCCPANTTEDHFLAHPEDYARHPPCFLSQLSSYDVNADLCAAVKYAQTLRAHGVRVALQLIPPEDEHCYCVGRLNETETLGDRYARSCADVSHHVKPENVTQLSCMGHELGFAKVVLPLVQFVVSVISENQ